MTFLVAFQEGRMVSTSRKFLLVRRWKRTWKWPQRSCTPLIPKASRARPDACCVMLICACTRARPWACTSRILSQDPTLPPLLLRHSTFPLPGQEISRKTKNETKRTAGCQQGRCPELTLSPLTLHNACLVLEVGEGRRGGGGYLHCALVEVLCSSCSPM